MVGYPDDSYAPELVWLDHAKLKIAWLDHAKLKIARELKPGMEFSYVFDLGDHWRHRCRVQDSKVDPLDTYGVIPELPVAVWGWGSIPDQYGRQSRDGDD